MRDSTLRQAPSRAESHGATTTVSRSGPESEGAKRLKEHAALRYGLATPGGGALIRVARQGGRFRFAGTSERTHAEGENL
jgi:hypothetical protein